MPADKIPVRSIAFLAFAGFASQATVRVTDSLLPLLANDFGVSIGSAAIVVTGYGIGHASAQIFIGLASRTLGTYRAAAIACTLAGLAVFACGLMPTLASLALMRFLSGAVAGWIVGLGVSYVGDVTPF